MFLLRWWRWLLGWVVWEAQGGAAARLLNLFTDGDLQAWGFQHGVGALCGCCFARDYKRMRPYARRTGMRVRVREKHGLPFLLRRYRLHGGLAVGAAAACLLLWFLSGRMWVVSVSGVSAEKAPAVTQTLEELGVYIGAPTGKIDQLDIQFEALERLPDITWLAVNMEGCIAHVEAVERLVGEPPQEDITASNLVAARDGRIVNITIVSGQRVAQVGDGVAEGTLLASGVVDTTVGPLLRRSMGVVLAETTREIRVEVPLSETLLLPTGEELVQSDLLFFGLQIPLYANLPVEGDYVLTEQNQPVTVNGVSLPIGIRNHRYALLRPTLVTRTAEEAAALARERLLEQEAEELATATIQNRTETAELVGDRYILTCTYNCIENIAKEVPIEVVDDAT